MSGHCWLRNQFDRTPWVYWLILFVAVLHSCWSFATTGASVVMTSRFTVSHLRPSVVLFFQVIYWCDRWEYILSSISITSNWSKQCRDETVDERNTEHWMMSEHKQVLIQRRQTLFPAGSLKLKTEEKQHSRNQIHKTSPATFSSTPWSYYDTVIVHGALTAASAIWWFNMKRRAPFAAADVCCR